MSHTNHSAKLSFQVLETGRGVGNEVVGGRREDVERWREDGEGRRE